MFKKFRINPESPTGKYIQFLSNAKDYRKYFAIAVFGMVLHGLTDAGFASLIKPLFDESLLKQDQVFGSQLALLLVVVLFFRGFGAYISNVFLAYVSQTITAKLRARLFHHLLSMPIAYFDTTPPGTLISKCTYNVGQASSSMSKVIITIIRDTVTVTALLAWLLYISWLMTLILLIAIPLISLLLKYTNKKFRIESTKIQDNNGLLLKDIEQMVKSIRTIKIFANNGYESSEFKKNNDLLRRHSIKFARIKALSAPVALFIVGIMFSFLVYFLTFEGVMEYISIGGIASFFVAVVMLMRPIRNLMNINPVIQQGIVAIDSLTTILDTPIEPNQCQIADHSFKGKVAFKEVSYKYANAKEWALKDINFTANSGDTVAIVGRSGAGKTTLMSMLARFYDSSEGKIEIDDQDIKDISLAELRHSISYVSQDTAVFHDTVRNNITYGRKVSDDELNEVMRKADVTEFVNNLPQGIDTIVNGEGNQLSAGQNQRVAIARALLKPSAIMLFDEATSFLDTATESIIKETLSASAGKATMFIIAHRLSTVENADFILVMDGGRIIERGTHSELLELDGMYAELYRKGYSKGLIE